MNNYQKNGENLIFDLGFHNGDDTDFYLKKGFKVVALEANPVLVKRGERRFKNYISNKKLFLINLAVSDKVKGQNFYIHPTRSDLSSCNKEMVEYDGSKAKIISVKTISFQDLCNKFGVPMYAKVDIEGCDPIVAKELYYLNKKPQYISFEISKNSYTEIFSWLHVSGYKKFQLINQLNHPNRDGNYKFTKYSSGFFGEDLLQDGWLPYDELLKRYLKYRELRDVDSKELALGWLDVHASL